MNPDPYDPREEEETPGPDAELTIIVTSVQFYLPTDVDASHRSSPAGSGHDRDRSRDRRG
jgi:hypothetical protein